jgi:hypothetical protein
MRGAPRAHDLRINHVRASLTKPCAVTCCTASCFGAQESLGGLTRRVRPRGFNRSPWPLWAARIATSGGTYANAGVHCGARRRSSQRFAGELVALRPDLILGNSTFVDLVLTGGTGAWSTNPDSAYEAHNHFR